MTMKMPRDQPAAAAAAAAVSRNSRYALPKDNGTDSFLLLSK